MNVIIYDLEILKAVPNRDGTKEDGIEYCAGWRDHANMGITVLGVYDYMTDRARVFCEDNKQEWQDLINSREPVCVGFNSIPFDNEVLMSTAGWMAPNERICYDLLRETWAAAGLGPVFAPSTHGGFSLDAMVKTNFGTEKSGNGALAPVDWQRGKIGKVIDYCLNDVRLTKQFFDAVIKGESIKNPKNGEPLRLLIPAV